MIQENFDYLKKQVMFTGFGDALEFALKENMEKGAEKFQLQHAAEFGKDTVNATLNFRLSEKGMYFFNSFDMTLQKEGAPPMNQTFFVYGPQAVEKPGETENGVPKKEWVNSNLTFKEGYNLMEGRAVLKDYVSKENQKYPAWAMLNTKETDENGNFKIKRIKDFDLETKLAGYPIKELANEVSKKELIDSLHKGNKQFVTMLSGGTEEKRAIEASPVHKGIKMFDGNQRTILQPEQGAKENQGSQNTAKNDQKQNENKQNNRKRQSRKNTAY